VRSKHSYLIKLLECLSQSDKAKQGEQNETVVVKQTADKAALNHYEIFGHIRRSSESITTRRTNPKKPVQQSQVVVNDLGPPVVCVIS